MVQKKLGTTFVASLIIFHHFTFLVVYVSLSIGGSWVSKNL